MAERDDRAAANSVQRRHRTQRAADAAVIQSIAICFVSALAGVLLLPYVGTYLLATAGAALAVARLRPSAFAESLGRAPKPTDFLLGAAAAIAGLALFFVVMSQLLADTRLFNLSAWRLAPLAVLLPFAVLPAFLEEWTCRGALWTICRRVAGPGTTLVITSVLFGLLHAPMWGWAGVPSRILLGFVFGATRQWSGGLAAPITAHLLNNTVALGFLMAA